MAYFQFVFAAITPLLFMGSILGRMKFKAWLLFVPLWITFVYSVNAALLWGGGFFAQKGAVDYSGGYVIHLSAGVAGFVAAAIVGPRLKRDRIAATAHNLPLVAIGAGILWLGWNGFNGGDPFYAGVDAASAVLNTNVATAAALGMWVFMDMRFSKQRKASFLGAINGMICGLVAITPSAGWVDGYGAILVGLIASGVVWVCFNYLPRVRPFSRGRRRPRCRLHPRVRGVDRGPARRIPGRPRHDRIRSGRRNFAGKGAFSVDGLFYTGSWHQEWEQLLAAVWIIVFTAVMTFVLLQIVKLVCRGLREKDEDLTIGDLAIHGEVAYPEDATPEEELAELVGAYSMAGVSGGTDAAGDEQTPLRGPAARAYGRALMPLSRTGWGLGAVGAAGHFKIRFNLPPKQIATGRNLD